MRPTEEIIVEILTKASKFYAQGEFYKPNNWEIQAIKSFAPGIIAEDTGLFSLDSLVEITDAIYDKLYDAAKKAWPENEFFIRVGYKDEGYGAEIKFEIPMGSLDELKEGDWDKWKLDGENYVIMEKLDGASVKLFYENGKLVQASSRGDGYVGKDITRHLVKFNNSIVPKELPEPLTCEIRGEVIIPRICMKVALERIQEELKRPAPYKNGRNTCAGILNGKNTPQAFAQFAHFVAYDSNLSEADTKSAELVYLKRLGFIVPDWSRVRGLYLNEIDLVNKVKEIKAYSRYECDGLVITLNVPPADYQGYEASGINPKHSRKFKIGATDNVAETVVEDIEWNISKDGYFKPRIKVAPVTLVGAEISYVTGDNYKFVHDSRVGIGAKIKLLRAGDVIPKIIEVLEPSDNIPALPAEYDLTENGIDAIFNNTKTFEKRGLDEANYFIQQMEIQQLLHFFKTLDIEGAGEGNVTAMANYWRTHYHEEEDVIGAFGIQQFFQLDKEDLMACLGKDGETIYNATAKRLTNVEEADFATAVGAFGRGIGVERLKTVAAKFGTLKISDDPQNIKEETLQQLNNLDGFSTKLVEQYKNYYPKYWVFCTLLTQVLKTNYPMFSFKKIEKLSNKYEKYCVCFTGIRDKEMEQRIIENGGSIANSVTEKCNMLIVKLPGSTSNKAKKAHEKGIPVITYLEALELFQ